jgi:hypothetical protein
MFKDNISLILPWLVTGFSDLEDSAIPYYHAVKMDSAVKFSWKVLAPRSKIATVIVIKSSKRDSII